MLDPVTVFISYSHDSPEHMDRVLDLSNRLRESGVDCRIDQYQESPPEGWPQWCDRQVEQSKFVLVACTETYIRRFKGEEIAGKGLGVTWEGHIITQELYNAQGKNSKFIPVIFSEQDATYIPVTLQSATHYEPLKNYDSLYRRLTGQPLIRMPALGSVKRMPPREMPQPLPTMERKQDFLQPWTVPYPKYPFFTGRERVLKDLRKMLERSGVAALSGLGGVGKTQTAVEYAYRHRKDYQGVLWAKAEGRDTLLSDFVSMAARFLTLNKGGQLSNARTEILPHQIFTAFTAVSSPLRRFMLADEVGLGKTIEAGMVGQALAQRGNANRTLIITPAGLTRQWQEEFKDKFLADDFEIFGRDFTATNPRTWDLRARAIASLDRLKRKEHKRVLLENRNWDLIIFDEAHRLSAKEYARKTEKTQNYQLAEALRTCEKIENR